MSVGSRRGFVLLDPGMGLERPIVVMQDGQSPHFGKILLFNPNLMFEVYNKICYSR